MSLTGKLGPVLAYGYDAEWNPAATWISSTGYNYEDGDWPMKVNVTSGRIISFRHNVDYGYGYGLVWSPGGTKFVLSADVNGDFVRDLVIMNVDGSNPKLVKAGTSEKEMTPLSWSPR